MKLVNGISAITCAVLLATTPGFAMAASSSGAVRPQTLSGTSAQGNTSQTSNVIAVNMAQVVSSSGSNTKNCGKGNNNSTGGGQNNGNCAASN